MKKTLILILLSTISIFSQQTKKMDYYEFERNGKLGKVNSLGKIIIPAIYENFGEVVNGLIPANLNGKYGVINLKNKIIIPFKYDYVSKIKNNLICVTLKEKDGWINTKNQIVIPIVYDYGVYLNDGTFIVTKDNKTGLINKTGDEIIEIKYERFGLGEEIREIGYNENKIAFERENRYGYLDKQKNIVIEPKFDDAYSFYNNHAIIKLGKKYGIINGNGEFEIEPTFDDIYYYKGFYKTKLNGKNGYLNSDLKVILNTEYDNVEGFINGLAVVEKDRKYGLINEKGEFVIPLIYDGAHDFSEGLIPVLRNGNWGYIDINNKIMIDFQFTGNVSSFENNMAIYYKRNFSSMGKYTSEICGLINKKGEIVITPKYKDILRYLENGRLIVEKDERDYLIDLREKIFFDLRQTEATLTSE
jgi:hypothetical protein